MYDNLDRAAKLIEDSILLVGGIILLTCILPFAILLQAEYIRIERDIRSGKIKLN